MMSFKKSTLFLLLVILSLQPKAQTAEEVIKGYISFAGGTDKWNKVSTIVTSGTYNYNGIEFPFTAYSKAPDLYKFIVPLQGKYFAQAFDGKAGWKIDAFKGETNKTIVTGKAALAMMNEADVELESPFINYLQKGHQATLTGPDTVELVPCFKIAFTRKNGNTEICYFNSSNFELVKKQAPSKNTELENGVLDIYYKDYRTVEGIKIPFLQENRLNNQPVLTITIKKIALNEPIADTEFKP